MKSFKIATKIIKHNIHNELVKLVFIENGMPEMPKIIDKACKKYSPLWQEALDCARKLVEVEKNN